MVLEVLGRAIRQEKEIGKKEAKLSLFINDMLLYVENPKEFIRKLLEINKFNRVAECKINNHISYVSIH